MTKDQLIRAIWDLPDETEILVRGMDHSYFRTTMEIRPALQDRNTGDFIEDFGEKNTPEAKWGKRKTVIVIQ